MTLAPAQELVDRDEILRLGGPWKRSGDWHLMYCPVHNDGAKHGRKGGQSLGLSDTGVLKCFAGCEFKDIIAALRGPNYSPAPRSIRSSSPERLVKTYQYKDENGVVVAEKGRFQTDDGRKTFRWRKPGSETWSGGVDLQTVPLYGVWKLGEPTEPVYFVEGEKACEACWDAGLLAVTHGGGAGTKDFGKTLDVLKGRDVYLWPDNDAPGRAHMTLLHARLQTLARSIKYINAPVPEKGDAFDYFAAGGTVEELAATSPNEPVVTILGEDALRVVVPTVGGTATMTFTEMEKSSRALEAEVVVECFNSQQRPYSQRMNLMSSSARNEIRLDLEKIYGKEYGWPYVLNTAIALAREAYLQQDRGQDVYDIPEPIGEVLLVPPLVVADGPTIIFGDGSSGKSYLTFRLALSIAMGLPFCNLQLPYMPVMVIDYEDSAPNFRRRMNRLLKAVEPELEPMNVYYWPANGIPLKDQVEAIKRKCDKHGIGLLIIDSAAPASGGPPEDAEATLAYFRALKKIGLPSVTIAHINKTGDTNKPFGSTFWHNEARRTWFVSRRQEDDSDEIDIGLYCRKVNDGRRPLPMGFHVTFEGMDGPVRIRPQDLNSVDELVKHTSPQNQVWMALEGAHSGMTLQEIVDATALTPTQVNNVLKDATRFETCGKRPSSGRGQPPLLWRRKTAEA